jgi:hypothetical protein
VQFHDALFDLFGSPAHWPASRLSDASYQVRSRLSLEEGGFESLAPLATEMLIELARGITSGTRMLAIGEIGPMPRLC